MKEVCGIRPKKRDTLVLTHSWGDFINYPVNISTLMVEPEKVKLHCNRIVSFTGIIYMCMNLKVFNLIHTYKITNKFSF